jgi:HD-GYP domain-containing protein (c-di-GMP phosphodiesterase class II)
MLILPLEEAQPTMRLALDVVHPERPEQVLLKQGYLLEPVALAKMRELGITHLYVDYPALDDLDRHLAPYLSPARQTIYQQVKSTIAAVQKRAQPTVGFADYYASTRQFIMTLMQEGQHPIYLELISNRLGSDAVSHATAVAHLSLVLGIRLERYLIDERSRLSAQHAREVVNLGVGGMLHDLGKAKLPEDLQGLGCLNVPQDEAKLKEWQTHPELGYTMIRGGVESSAAAAVLYHHEHYDGSGFPISRNRDGTLRQLSGSKIHVFARIVHAADLYDRLSMGPEGKGQRAPVEILHRMRTDYEGWVDPHVMRILPAVIPPFPPGGKVKLSDGATAVVTKVHLNDPYHPIVQRLAEDKWTLVGEPVDLSQSGAPEIASLGKLRVKGMMPEVPVKA